MSEETIIDVAAAMRAMNEEKVEEKVEANLHLELVAQAHEILGDRNISDLALDDPYWDIMNRARAAKVGD